MSATFGISRGDLSRALNTALKFTSKDESLLMICGLDLSIHDGKLAIVGTDRFRIGAVRMEVNELNGTDGRLGLLGRDAVNKLLNVIRGGTASQKREPLMVRVDLSTIEVTDVDNSRISFQLQGSEFPKIDQILSATLADKGTCGTWHVNPDFLADFRFARWNSNDPMRVHATSASKPLVITIGDHFLGLQMLVRGKEIEFDEYVAPWLELFAPAPAPEPEKPKRAPRKKAPAKKAPARRTRAAK